MLFVVTKLAYRIFIQDVVSILLFYPHENIYRHSVRVMVSRRRFTDHMYCWVQRIVVVTLTLGEFTRAKSKLIIELGCPGGLISLLALCGSRLQSPISRLFAVALSLHLGRLLLMTLQQHFELEIVFELCKGS